MGRPRTIHVDHSAVLDGVRRVLAETLADFDGEIADAEQRLPTAPAWEQFRLRQDVANLRDARQDLALEGVTCNLDRFAGRELTPSERIRWGEMLRRLRDEGHVELLPPTRATRVRLVIPSDAIGAT